MTLREQLEKKLAFDENLSQRSMPRLYEHIDRVDLWVMAQKNSTARLQPILTALLDCVEALEKKHNIIGQVALQIEFETVWGDPNNVKQMLEQTIDVQKRWFTEMRESLNNLRKAVKGE